MRPFLKNRKLKSFTLIELLLVIFIITLVYISITMAVSDTSRADYDETKHNLVTLIKFHHNDAMIRGEEIDICFLDTTVIFQKGYYYVSENVKNCLYFYEYTIQNITFYPDGYVTPCNFIIMDKTGIYSNIVSVSEFGKIHIGYAGTTIEDTSD